MAGSRVRKVDGTDLPRASLQASLVQPDGEGGAAYLAYPIIGCCVTGIAPTISWWRWAPWPIVSWNNRFQQRRICYGGKPSWE